MCILIMGPACICCIYNNTSNNSNNNISNNNNSNNNNSNSKNNSKDYNLIHSSSVPCSNFKFYDCSGKLPVFNFINSAQGVNSKKLDHFESWSSFLVVKPWWNERKFSFCVEVSLTVWHKQEGSLSCGQLSPLFLVCVFACVCVWERERGIEKRVSVYMKERENPSFFCSKNS